MLIYKQVLSATQREAVGRYLTGKYALPGITTPSVPSAVTTEAISSTQVSLTWSDTLSGEGVIYVIERKSGDGDYEEIAEVTDTLSYIDTGLTAGTEYTYRIYARTYDGESAYSSTTSATTLATATDVVDMPLSGMALWLKADAGITGEGAMSKWSDQSGNGYDATQTTSAYRPTLVGNSLNGHPVVKFDGSNDYLSLSSSVYTAMKAAGAGEVFIVVKAEQDTSTTWRGMWCMGSSSSYEYYPTMNSEVHIKEDWGSTTQYDVGAPVDSLYQYNLYNVSGSASGWACRLNGSVLYQSASNMFGFNSNPRLGTNSSNYFNGEIAEVLIYKQVLSAAQRETVGRYLNLKYALPDYANFDKDMDLNEDGLPDSVDREMGIDPTNMDIDGDGLTNAQELALGTDPFNADTDYDGVPDGQDAYPLDPTRSSAPSSGSGDTSGPTVTLSTPDGATLN